MSPKSTPDAATDPRPPVTTRPAAGLRMLVAATAVAFAGCGGGDAEDTTTADEATEERTTGGEASAQADAGTDEALDEEPAAAGAEDAAPEDAEEDDAEAAAATADEEDEPDPQVAWRRKVRRGRRVFERVCGVCHPGGEEDLGPRIIGKRLSPRSMRRQIRQGVGRMRPIPPSKLPDRYMDELFAYLSTIRAVRGISRP